MKKKSPSTNRNQIKKASIIWQCFNKFPGCEIYFPWARFFDFKWSDELCQLWKDSTNQMGTAFFYFPVIKKDLSKAGYLSQSSYGNVYIYPGPWVQIIKCMPLHMKYGQRKFTFRRHLALPPNQPCTANHQLPLHFQLHNKYLIQAYFIQIF